VRKYSAALGFEIGAHALRATAATNALDHEADIAIVIPISAQLRFPGRNLSLICIEILP
jgi:hypothetical protein